MYAIRSYYEKFTNFDLSDGLQALEFNAGVYCQSKDGEMFFGGINGYNSFYPEKVSENPYIPPVYVSDFQISHTPVEIGAVDSPLKKHISQTEALYLDYKQSTMTFRITSYNVCYTKLLRRIKAVCLQLSLPWQHKKAIRKYKFVILNLIQDIFV